MPSLILPIMIPCVTAILLCLVNGRYRLEKLIALVGNAALVGFIFWLLFHVKDNGVQSTVLGGWEAPFGIAFVADMLSCIMLCLSGAVGFVVLLYTFSTVTQKQQKYFFYPLYNIVLMGVNWAFLSGDIFNLFVSYEVMLIGSYGMMMVGASKAQVRQTMKYIAINAVGSSFFVVGVGLLYATIGTTNMAEMADRTAKLTGDQATLVNVISTVLMVVFGMKTAAFPLFFWLPDTYPVVPTGVNGYFAGLLTKVGVYSLLRVFVMCFQQPGAEIALNIILAMSAFTMLLGVLGAMCQWEIRKILSWHIISQVGYMVMGIGLCGAVIVGTNGDVDNEATDMVRELAIVGTIFYIVHHIIVKSCLFLVSGIAERVTGTQELKKMGGVLDISPGVAGLFLIASFSLAGMPPFSGFLSKFVVVKAGLAASEWLVVTVAIVTSFFTLYSMTKIWSYAFWRGKCREKPAGRYRAMMVPTGVLVIFTVVMGLFGQPFYDIAEIAAKDVQNPKAYIDSVLSHRNPKASPKMVMDNPAPLRDGSSESDTQPQLENTLTLTEGDKTEPTEGWTHQLFALPQREASSILETIGGAE